MKRHEWIGAILGCFVVLEGCAQNGTRYVIPPCQSAHQACSRDTDCCDNFCEMTSGTGGYCTNPGH